LIFAKQMFAEMVTAFAALQKIFK